MAGITPIRNPDDSISIRLLPNDGIPGANLVSGFSGVTDSQDFDLTAIILVQHDIAAVSEWHKPLAEPGRHLLDRSTEFRVSAQDFDTLANRADRTSRSFTVFRRKEGTETRDIPQCRRCPDDRCHWSGVRGRRFNILAGFQPREPRVSFVVRDVQASRLIFSQRRNCIVPQLLTAFLALDVLLYGFPHEHIRRPSPCFGKPQQTALSLGV
jgi:hypothetical protein